MSDREQLLHLVDRARRGVALPAELDLLAAGITELEQALADADAEYDELAHHTDRTCEAVARADQAEAALEQAELDAEQQARHFRTLSGERESYRQAWKYEQKRRATAEAAIERVKNLAEVWGDAPDPLVRASARDLRTTIAGPRQPTT
ncbi:hypothetical protein ACFRCI_09510 [Streptomyces sp. NPDC056638]|uniref:hypothetical protein n=1 Tax=Streptomyces sp. NPDC056638 TaxID=3345887 RepID=UPI00369A1BF4